MLQLFGFWEDQIMCWELLQYPTGAPLPQHLQEGKIYSLIQSVGVSSRGEIILR